MLFIHSFIRLRYRCRVGLLHLDINKNVEFESGNWRGQYTRQMLGRGLQCTASPSLSRVICARPLMVHRTPVLYCPASAAARSKLGAHRSKRERYLLSKPLDIEGAPGRFHPSLCAGRCRPINSFPMLIVNLLSSRSEPLVRPHQHDPLRRLLYINQFY